jgi:hypothetical protein
LEIQAQAGQPGQTGGASICEQHTFPEAAALVGALCFTASPFPLTTKLQCAANVSGVLLIKAIAIKIVLGANYSGSNFCCKLGKRG